MTLGTYFTMQIKKNEKSRSKDTGKDSSGWRKILSQYHGNATDREDDFLVETHVEMK